MNRYEIPDPELQVTFYNRLEEIRDIYLLDALLAVVAESDIPTIDRELSDLVSNQALQKIAGWSLRGEIVFPVPYILEQCPDLLGYYRLLLGFSQKQFYGSQYGFGPFKSMEISGRVSAANKQALPELCRALCQSAERLLAGIGKLSKQSVHELTLLTLGPQLRGGALNLFGTRATRRVFDLIKSIIQPAIVKSTERAIEICNAAGRTVTVEFASDPDICIREALPSGAYRNLVAIEIKGGRDFSNIHNRIGEAEKSHQKARNNAYVECWTIVGITALDLELAKRESPTTDRFFHLESITHSGASEYLDFLENLQSRVGIGS